MRSRCGLQEAGALLELRALHHVAGERGGAQGLGEGKCSRLGSRFQAKKQKRSPGDVCVGGTCHSMLTLTKDLLEYRMRIVMGMTHGSAYALSGQ